MDRIYLDNNATTRPAEEVLEAMREVNERYWANPSSVHRFGQQVRRRVELAREQIAGLIGCRDRELVFTSGGTESNNLALAGILGRGANGQGGSGRENSGRPVLITSKIEHSAIREPAEALTGLGAEVVYVPVDRGGRVSGECVAEALRGRGDEAGPVLISVQWANNETGTIQPIAEIVQACRDFNASADGARAYLHTDATQAVGKVPVDVSAVGVDLLTLSGHKFHGPKGVGALFVRGGVRLWPQQRGGPQERQRRGGTENTPGIIGLAEAARLADAVVRDRNLVERLAAMRDGFEQAITGALPDTVINGVLGDGSPQPRRLWNTSNLGFPHLEAEAIVVALSERGVCVSAGAACSSGSLEPSPVLLAMGVPEPVAHGSVRFSIGRETAEQELRDAAVIVVEVVRRLRRTLPMGV